jgi:hypothetical protein
VNRNVFISYSSHDSAIARQFADFFTAKGIRHFLDQKDIVWGETVEERIAEGIQASTDLLVILSPASVKSQWVPFEIGRAKAARKRVLPFLTHPCLEVPGFLNGIHHETSFDEAASYFQSASQSERPPLPTDDATLLHDTLSGTVWTYDWRTGSIDFGFGADGLLCLNPDWDGCSWRAVSQTTAAMIWRTTGQQALLTFSPDLQRFRTTGWNGQEAEGYPSGRRL